MGRKRKEKTQRTFKIFISNIRDFLIDGEGEKERKCIMLF